MSEQTRSYSTAAPDEYSSRVSSTGAAKQRPTSGASPWPLGSIISHKHRVTGAVLSRYQSQLLLTGASLHPPHKKGQTPSGHEQFACSGEAGGFYCRL